ncbi:hypothetical protein N7454_002920 [Penicillium verhagenii]|nr:hypothetical protein N7454_002920 [Penicillium verhagenii]
MTSTGLQAVITYRRQEILLITIIDNWMDNIFRDFPDFRDFRDFREWMRIYTATASSLAIHPTSIYRSSAQCSLRARRSRYISTSNRALWFSVFHTAR